MLCTEIMSMLKDSYDSCHRNSKKWSRLGSCSKTRGESDAYTCIIHHSVHNIYPKSPDDVFIL